MRRERARPSAPIRRGQPDDHGDIADDAVAGAGAAPGGGHDEPAEHDGDHARDPAQLVVLAYESGLVVRRGR